MIGIFLTVAVLVSVQCYQKQGSFKNWQWNRLNIPAYSWPKGTAFGPGLYVDVAYDPNGVSIVGDHLRFVVDPVYPAPPADALTLYNYRSEIRTAPWPIRHPLGTEQWMGFYYLFPEDYQINTTTPIIIYQNHPGIQGFPPQFELEIAARNRPRPATGGEIQVVNHTNGSDPQNPHRGDRFVYPVRPLAGDTLSITLHVVYGRGPKGLLQVWLNDSLYYNRRTSTVFATHQWGGNNKWGIYHHSYKHSDVRWEANTIRHTKFWMEMGPLRLLTRHPHHPKYLEDAYELVRPKF